MKVYDYDVDGSRHCREGVATEEHPDVFLDTYWGWGSDRHRLTETEQASMRLRFDTDEFEHLEPTWDAEDLWMTYAPADRQTIPSQHGHRRELWVRRGASPDLTTRIENARQVLFEADSAARSAIWRFQRAQADLRKLEATS